MHFYNGWAQRILRGEFTDYHAFYGLPLYAYLLAAVYTLIGYNPLVVGFLQAILDGATAALIYRIALRVIPIWPIATAGSPPTFWGRFATHSREIGAVCAALGWGFFVPAQAYSIVLMPTSWFVFVFWFVVWQIVKNETVPSQRKCLFLGFLIGFTAMGVATILFLVPLLLAAVWVRSRKTAGRGLTPFLASALLLLGVTVGTSPCWIHNYFIARDPVVLSAHSGINFWIGNNPDANGYPRFPPGLRAGQAAMLEDSVAAAESAAGHPLKRAEVSAFWSSKARDYITHHFIDWLKLLFTKFRNFWSAFQYDDLSIITSLREHGIILPGIYFGLVAALALPGMLLSWRIPAAHWVIAAIALHFCALMPVFVTERYRLAVVPGLLVFAAAGLSILWQACLRGEFRTAAIHVVVVMAAAIFISAPQRSRSLWALDAYNAGWQALESNNLPLAERKLSLAHAYVPDNAETNFALGNLRFTQGNPTAADAFYRATLQIDPKHKGALNNLGMIALDARDYSAARLYFQSALAQDRRSAKTHFLLAKTAQAQGDVDLAEREIGEALSIWPTQSEFLELKKELAQQQVR
jgi:Tfp pilus assembly protein PilF